MVVKGADLMSKGLASLLAKIFRKAYWTDNRIGEYGETLTERKLNLLNLFGRKGRVLRNVYIPKGNNRD